MITSWYKSGNGENVKPPAIEEGKTYMYVRKDFELIPAKGEDEHFIIPEHWEWMEQKIRKEDWEFYQKTYENSSEIEDCNNALMELYEMIAEV